MLINVFSATYQYTKVQFAAGLNLVVWWLYWFMALTAAAGGLPTSSDIDSLSIRDAANTVVEPHEAFEQEAIPARLWVLFGLESDRRYVVREAVVAEFRVLTDAEKQALICLLAATADEVYLQRAELNSLKDSVVKVLKRQVGFSDELAATLMVLYDDNSVDPVWRDYCIQHLADLYRQDPGNADMKKVLLRASWDKTGTLAGTALLAIRKNVPSGFTEDVLLQRAFAVAVDETYSDIVRLTAFQVCAECGDVRVLPLARQIVGSRDSIHLRMSAIAVLGRFGKMDDRERVNQYVLSSDSRLRIASNAAMELLNQRFATFE